ncbi:MAG: MMPL family transporter [Halobacteria archaeon]|nr:MMPL family transporter [Halobacteria archaeon]
MVDRSKYVILGFFLVTFFFAMGWGGISTQAGTDQFTEQTPAQEAMEEIQRRFNEPFTKSSGSTQLIQKAQNVVSKKSLIKALTIQERLADAEGLRVSSTSGPAHDVAKALNPSADTLDEKINALQAASNAEVSRAVRRLARTSDFESALSSDFNREAATADSAIYVVEHTLPAVEIQQGGGSGSSPLTDIQLRARDIVNTVNSDVTVFGSGIFSKEFNRVIGDSLLIVMPVAVVLILTFLILSFRDPFDLLLGLVCLGMAITWTFGFIGLVGIPFSIMIIAVPPLLIATGIDFGIHAINRYREEKPDERGTEAAMRKATDQLLVAFFIVTLTTVIGFLSNLTSAVTPIRQFGVVAAAGIVFTFLIFGVFLPAAKVWSQRWRDRLGAPTFSTTALGSEGSLLGRLLPFGAKISRPSPEIFLLGVLVFTTATGFYATGVDTSFKREDFLPADDMPDPIENLPEPFAPSDYTAIGSLNYLEDKFEINPFNEVQVYVEGHLTSDYALESMARASRNPPDSIVSENRTAKAESIIDVIGAYARASPEFRRLVRSNDVDSNGVPDDSLERIYDELLSSPYRDEALNYITEDKRRARISFTVKTEAEPDEVVSDGKQVGDKFRLEVTPTGGTIVFQSLSEMIFLSAAKSLAVALIVTAVFLVLIYHVIERRASIGLANLVPVAVSVALIVGTMRALGVPFNALTATVLSITIGLGVDYSVHVTHRFVDEYDRTGDVHESLYESLRGTGGALTGSMLTDVSGIGALVLAVAPLLIQFGIITSISIFYSYVTSVVVLPPTLMVWEKFFGEY